MTREEAIQELKYAQAMCQFDPSTGEVGFRNTEDERQHEAFGIATRSLEAWEKVQKEIMEIGFDWEHGDDYRVPKGVKDCLEIINKHMGEVTP